jgi:hypothetical protein
MKEETDNKWRLCKQHEIIAHLTSGCSILRNEYLTGHDRVGARVNDSESKTPGIETTKKKGNPPPPSKPVCEHDDAIGLWHQEVRTGTPAKCVN